MNKNIAPSVQRNLTDTEKKKINAPKRFQFTLMCLILEI